MTVLKIQGNPSTAAKEAIEPHMRRIYTHSGVRFMAVVELAHTERTEPAADSEKPPTVTVRVVGMEIPARDQEESLREVQRSLYLQRTSAGTIDEDGKLILSKQTIEDAAGIIGHISVARMGAGINYWLNYLRRVQAKPELTVGELRHEIDAIADGLTGLLGTPPEEEGW
jgi:hypothetical protein